jgi:Response regulator containing a CheY-like receiver domain and an HTH DNA-binding domain
MRRTSLRTIVNEMPTAQLEVLILDDDEIVCAWLRASLAGTEFRVAGEASSRAAALKLLERRRIDLLLVDFQLQGENGLELVRGLRAEERMTPAVIMTASPQRGLSEEAREAGAQATLLKSSKRESLLAALRAVAAGKTWFDPAHPSRSDDASPLTPREREVLTLVARGLTNREAAEQLELGEESVKTYLERAYGKLGVSRRAEAVAEAHRLGLLGR